MKKRVFVNQENYDLIKKMNAGGVKYNLIMASTGVSYATVSNVINSSDLEDYRKKIKERSDKRQAAKKNLSFEKAKALVKPKTTNHNTNKSKIFAISEVDLMSALKELRGQNDDIMTELISIKAELSELKRSRTSKRWFKR